MNRQIEVIPTRSYATKENAEKAVQAFLNPNWNLRYFITCTPSGRFFPVFIGKEAIECGLHFRFNVIG